MCFSESRIRRDSDTSSLGCGSVKSHLEGPTVKPEDEKPLLLPPDSFISHTSGPTQSATAVNDSVATVLTPSIALNTLPPILPQKHSTFENKSTTEVCNCTDETLVGLSKGRAGQSLGPRGQYKSESATRKQCDGGRFVREKRMGIEENLNSDNEKVEMRCERPDEIYDKTKRKNQTRNAKCSSDALEGDGEFPLLNAEKMERKELVQKAIKQSRKSNRAIKTPSFGGRGRGKRPNFDSKHKATRPS